MHNHLYSSCYWHYNHVLLIRMHDLDASDLQEKLFFPSFSLQTKFIHEMRQTWILIIISIRFVIGTAIVFSTLWYMVLMLWICKKGFSSLHFPYNQSSSVKWWIEANFDTRNNLRCFSYGHWNYVLLIGIDDTELWICNRSFPFHIFLIRKIHPCNEINLDTHNNLRYFCYWHYNYVRHIGIHIIDALDLQEKLFFPPFSL